jgi:transposase
MKKKSIIIFNYDKGRKIVDIAKMLDLNYNSVKTIVNRYKQTGDKKIKARSGRPIKLTERRERLIIREMKKDRRSTKQNLLYKVNENQNIKISSKTLKKIP